MDSGPSANDPTCHLARGAAPAPPIWRPGPARGRVMRYHLTPGFRHDAEDPMRFARRATFMAVVVILVASHASMAQTAWKVPRIGFHPPARVLPAGFLPLARTGGGGWCRSGIPARRRTHSGGSARPSHANAGELSHAEVAEDRCEFLPRMSESAS